MPATGVRRQHPPQLASMTMTLHSRWTPELPCVVQAPMAGVQDHRLTMAVCEADGLGSLAAAMLSPADLERELQALQRGTQRPYNVNFF